MYQVHYVSIIELNSCLELLRKDVVSMSDLDASQMRKLPILYDKYDVSLSDTSDSETKQDGRTTPISCPDDDDHQADRSYRKILKALDSCNFYLNALSSERNSFDTEEYPIADGAPISDGEVLIDLIIEKEEHGPDDLTEYFKTFNDKAWKIFAEMNSFCKLLMTTCKTLSTQIADADEVLYAFKHSLEVYEQAMMFDVSCPDNAEEVLRALATVKSSTRSLQSYLWVIKTLMAY